MINCAYCDKRSQATREHVIPDWYIRTPGEGTLFSARAPFTHVSGELVVKDVCSNCNNVILAALDGYGKELYEQSFISPVYTGEEVEFRYDGDRLIRWLLKLSYNSARAQNADIRVLREYRRMMLGSEPISDRVRVWVSLVTPTMIDDSGNSRPAMRHESGMEDVDEPLWFRISQFRLPAFRAYTLVQRLVLINSFRFTILVAPVEEPMPSADFDRWCAEFERANPCARPILPGIREVTIATDGDHVGTSLYPLMSQYPTRFLNGLAPEFEDVVRGKVPLIALHLTPEMIAASDAESIMNALRYMTGTRENAMATKLKVDIMVSGYEDDPRGLWQVPEVREYFRTIFAECPYVMLLSHPHGSLLKLMLRCWIYEDDLTDETYSARVSEFFDLAFQGLNDKAYDLAIGEEVNREVCAAVDAAIRSQPPSSR
jgi:hypothetical protein